MGTSQSVIIQVNFNRSNCFYLTGEQVLGTISLQNEHNQLKLDDASIDLIGELGYTTQETRTTTDSEGKSTSESYTDYHDLPFLTMHLSLVQSKHGEVKL